MWKVSKYKIYSIFQDKIFVGILVSFFIILNYTILKSGVIYPACDALPEMERFALLINNYDNQLMGVGLILAIYMGSNMLDDDIKSGRLGIMLISISKRTKYMFGSIVGGIASEILILMLCSINYFLISWSLKIQTNYLDLFRCSVEILINMTVVFIVSSLFSIIMSKRASLLSSFLLLIYYNIYTFKSVPMVNKNVIFKPLVRKIMICFFPMTNVYPHSVYTYYDLSEYIVEPFICGNTILYQLIFIFLVFLLVQQLFDNKEL